MPRFIHADLIAKYAQDAAECSEPWLRWQFAVGGAWFDADRPLSFRPDVQYRRKPRTVRIGEFDVPEPVREPLKSRQKYWVACTSYGAPIRSTWTDGAIDKKWLIDGLIHLTEEAAQQHIVALISFTRRTVEGRPDVLDMVKQPSAAGAPH